MTYFKSYLLLCFILPVQIFALAEESKTLSIESPLFGREKPLPIRLENIPENCFESVKEHIGSIQEYMKIITEGVTPSTQAKLSEVEKKLSSSVETEHICGETNFIFGAMYSLMEIAYNSGNAITPEPEAIYLSGINRYLNMLNEMKVFSSLSQEVRDSHKDRLGSMDVIGGFSCKELKIWLDRRLKPFDLASTFMHELYHLRFIFVTDSLKKVVKNPYFEEDVLFLNFLDEYLATLSASVSQVAILFNTKKLRSNLSAQIHNGPKKKFQTSSSSRFENKNDLSFFNHPSNNPFYSGDAVYRTWEQYFADKPAAKYDANPEAMFDRFLRSSSWNAIDEYWKNDPINNAIDRWLNNFTEYKYMIDRVRESYFSKPNQSDLSQKQIFLIADITSDIGHSPAPNSDEEYPYGYRLVPPYLDINILKKAIETRDCEEEVKPGAEGVGISKGIDLNMGIKACKAIK